MDESLFTETPRFSKGVQLINGLDIDRFPKLLTRILQNLHNKAEPAFNEAEQVKLGPALGLTSSELVLVIETLTFICQQAAYHAIKPGILMTQLEAVAINSDKCKAICEGWSAHGKSTIEKLKKHSFAPKQLQSVEWHLNLQLAQDSKSNLKEPNAIFQLNVENNDNDTASSEPVLLEFNHSQLFNLYNKLEVIQSQLDSLS